MDQSAKINADHPYERVGHAHVHYKHRKVTRVALMLISGSLDIGGLSPPAK